MVPEGTLLRDSNSGGVLEPAWADAPPSFLSPLLPRPLTLPDELAEHFDRPRDPAAVARVAMLWPEWLAIADALADPDVELLAEEFGPVWLMFQRLRGAGVHFHDSFCRRMHDLRREVIGTDADSDFDAADERIDLDDSDEDQDHDGSADMQPACSYPTDPATFLIVAAEDVAELAFAADDEREDDPHFDAVDAREEDAMERGDDVNDLETFHAQSDYDLMHGVPRAEGVAAGR